MQVAPFVFAPLACLLTLCVALLAPVSAEPAGPRTPVEPGGPFARFELPDDWEARFWADSDVKALLALDARALAELVPVQAGVRFCRCPGCHSSEADDSLSWAPGKPAVVTCRRCGISVPNDKFPAKVAPVPPKTEKMIPEETVEVLLRVIHHYPYHTVDPHTQLYPDERLYLSAKRDYEARTFLAKAALYAAVRHHEQPAGRKDPTLARLACVLLLRFAQVYPAYATHFDQPGQPKYFQPADLPPPYRRGYRTAKWEWTASLDVPMNLVIAYALVRADPALAEAGRQLNEANPSRTIERKFFRASAEFVRRQPEEYSEVSIQAYRGLLAVGRLLDDPVLIREGRVRMDEFTARGFFHDGYWRQGDSTSHRRVLGQIDGWLDHLLTGTDAAPPAVAGGSSMLALARAAGSAPLAAPPPPEVQRVSWPAPMPRSSSRLPVLLGGAGLARLAVGAGDEALDLELRGMGNYGSLDAQRLALRVAIGGRPILGDLDEGPPTASGWDRATLSHNTVVIDGLNQRETPAAARESTPGGNFLFYAADPDFQVATLDDPRAYPQATGQGGRYRQTVVAVSGAKVRYAVSIFEVWGGLQHDQVFHAAAGSPARWRVAAAMSPGPVGLLPPSIPHIASAQAEDGRWFVQAYGDLAPLVQVRLTRPTLAELTGPDGRGVRLHLLGDSPMSAITALGPDPNAEAPRTPSDEPGRAALMLRRTSTDGGTLMSMFVTVFEPVGGGPPLLRVGRVATLPGSVVVYLETAEGKEHLAVNLTPGTPQTVPLADGTSLTTDGLAVRFSDRAMVLAGGTFAESSGRQVRQVKVSGMIRNVVRRQSAGSRGWFEADAPLSDPDLLAGRVLHIRHGDGITRGWTLERAENTPEGARLHVREEPGFDLDPQSQSARYYQFPRDVAPGPHFFRVSKIAR